jgi:hypothetical protein
MQDDPEPADGETGACRDDGNIPVAGSAVPEKADKGADVTDDEAGGADVTDDEAGDEACSWAVRHLVSEAVQGLVADTASDDPFVTFVVPSIGRNTLERALRSLDVQTDQAFRAILVADGFVAPASLSARFPWLSIAATGARLGRANHAGAVRNIGIEMAATEWVAFLDDDDALSPRYVEWLRAEIRASPDADAVVFRMRTDKAGPRHKVLPPIGETDFAVGRVGISFAALRSPKSIVPKLLAFRPGSTEDFDLLDRLRSAGSEMVLSPRVAYFVEMLPEDDANKK